MVVRKNISHLLVFVWSSRASFWLSVHISLSQCYIPEGRNNWPYVQLAQHLFSSVNFSRCHLSLHDHKCGQTFANMEKWTRTHSSFTIFYLSYNHLCSFSAPRVGSTIGNCHQSWCNTLLALATSGILSLNYIGEGKWQVWWETLTIR